MERIISLNKSWRFAVDNAAERKAASAKHQWKFRKVKAGQEDGFKSNGFDDSRWELVDLPHDYSIRTDFSEKNVHMCGAKDEVNVWYRKNFLMDEKYADKHFTLIFEGISMTAEIYFNGSLMAVVPGAYTWTEIDITPRMHFGKNPNYISVFVRGDTQQIWKYEGIGIYDNVKMLVREHLNIAHNGLWTHSEKLPSGQWLLHCEAEIDNHLYENRRGKVVFELFDRENNSAGIVEQQFDIESDSRQNVKTALQIASPRLWDLDDPYLYKVVCSVICNDKITDTENVSAGFRTAEFDSEKGFFLNGKKVFIQGFSNHFEHAGVGYAVPAAISEYRIQCIKNMGSNAYRCAHYECLESVLDACDKLGVLVMDENRMFETRPSNIEMLRNQIRRNRKHPSVSLYGLFSEEPLQCTAEGGKIYRKLKSEAAKIDNTRPFSGSAQRVQICCETDSVLQPMDVAGINYEVWNWEKVHTKYPEKPIIATEMTCMQTMRGELEYSPEKLLFDDYSTENHWFGMTAFETWKFVMDCPYLAGVFNHSAFDHRGEPQPLGYPLISCSYGAMDTCGFPKTLYYVFQSCFQKEPMMYIFPHWNHRQGETVKVITVTNCDSCELFLNGRSLGVKECDLREPCLWDVAFEPGTLQAVGYRNGQKVSEYEVKTAFEPYRLIAEPHKTKIKNDSYDAVAVNIQAVDRFGTPCPDADNLVSFKVSGGRILGVGNGNPGSHEPDFAESRKLYHGKCQSIISCNAQSEELIIEAESAGLFSAVIEMQIEAVPPEFQLCASDSRIIDNWKVASCASSDKPDPNIRIDWSENNAYVNVNMSSERYQDDLQPGWMLYRAELCIPNSAGKDTPAHMQSGLGKYKNCEIWVNGEMLLQHANESEEIVAVPSVDFTTKGAETLYITILLETSGGKAGLNGRDRDISIILD